MRKPIEYKEGDVLGDGLVYLNEVEGRLGPKGRVRRSARFKCKCGGVFETTIELVKGGHTKSCGCLKNRALVERNKRNVTHNLSGTLSYITYQHMVARCFDDSRKDYKYYGGRGIKVCPRWSEPNGRGLENFYSDMGERPEGLSLDRIRVDGHYSPENCRWADRSTQSFNSRLSSKSKTGKAGVKGHPDGGYTASISVDGARKHLIYTKDLELAIFCGEEARSTLSWKCETLILHIISNAPLSRA